MIACLISVHIRAIPYIDSIEDVCQIDALSLNNALNDALNATLSYALYTLSLVYIF